MIAHEVSHLRHGDLQTARRIRLTMLFVACAAMFLVALATPNFIDLPVHGAVFATAAIFCRLSLSPLRQRSERRGDIYGARLSGDPQALSSALVAASRFADEARRRFVGVGVWRWLLWPCPGGCRATPRFKSAWQLSPIWAPPCRTSRAAD